MYGWYFGSMCRFFGFCPCSNSWWCRPVGTLQYIGNRRSDPYAELLKQIRAESDIAVRCLMRPRAGDFLYTKEEIRMTAAQIETLRNLGADVATIRPIALMCKMPGTDVHHLGDAGYGGVSPPENIWAYSIAIRGILHTYRRMAGSVNR